MSYPVWMKNNSGTRFIGSTYHYYRNMPYGYDSKCYLRVLTESQIAAEGAVHKAIKIPCKTAGKVSLSARFAEWPDTTSGADAVTHATAALTNGDWVSQKTILGDELGLAYRWAKSSRLDPSLPDKRMASKSVQASKSPGWAHPCGKNTKDRSPLGSRRS